MIARLREREASALAEEFNDSRGETRGSINAGAHGGPAEGELGGATNCGLDAFDPVAYLRGKTTEFLAEGDGGSVHKVRAAALHHPCEFAFFALERARERLEGRYEESRDIARHGEMHGCGEGVVARLRSIDVVVRVHRSFVRAREMREHLVHIHV